MTAIGALKSFFRPAQGLAEAGVGAAGRGAGRAAARDLLAITQPEGLTVSLMHNSLDDFASFARGTQKEFSGEMFALCDNTSAQLFKDMSSKGVSQRLLLDPERATDILAKLPKVNVETATYGAMPYKVHAKSFVTDGNKAFMTTGAFTSVTNGRIEGVAQFSGDAAKALDEVINAGISGIPSRMNAANKVASQYGILMNDSLAGSTHLTDTVHKLIKSAKSDLTVSTKIFNDPGIRQAIQGAENRGVRVHFTDIRAQNTHANVLIADEKAYVGTAHFSPRGMGDMRYAYRKARDGGLLVTDPKIVTSLRQQMDSFGMKAWTPKEFDVTRKAHDAIDGFSKLQARAKLTPGAVSAEKLTQAQTAATEAKVTLADIRTQVAKARQADGITFLNPAGNAAVK